MNNLIQKDSKLKNLQIKNQYINQNSQSSFKSTNNNSLSTKSSFKTESIIENNRYIKSARRKIGLSKDQVKSLEFDFKNNQISSNVKQDSKNKIISINIKSSNNKTLSKSNLQNIKKYVSNDSSNILNKFTNVEEQYQSPDHLISFDKSKYHQGVLIGSQEYNKSTASNKDMKR